MAPRRPRDIGTDAERAVVRWLQTHGWPHAERRALRGTQDAGDITGTPGICWEIKAGAQTRLPSDMQLADWLAETIQQRSHARADHAVLVTRRHGTADPGRWWAWLHIGQVARLADQAMGRARQTPHGLIGDHPVCMHLAAAVALLHAAGYGGDAA